MQSLLTVDVDKPRQGWTALTTHDTMAEAFRSFERIALGQPLFGGIIRVTLTEVGKKHFGTNTKNKPNGITHQESVPYSCAGCTFTDFSEPPRVSIIGRHTTHATAVRQYRRIWNVYHKLHGYNTWLYLDPRKR